VPNNKKPTVAERVEQLNFIDEVDELLLEGSSASDVARYIQQTMMKLKDVALKTLVKVLTERRKQLKEESDEEEELSIVAMSNAHPASDGPHIRINPDTRKIEGDINRSPTSLARVMYDRYVGNFNLLLELESIYLSQRDRISRMMLIEERLGMPLDDLGKEFDIARKLLVAHANVQKSLGLHENPHSSELSLSLTLKGMKSKLGADVLDTLKDPQSRHKVLNALRAISSDPELPGQIIDGEATELG